MFIALRAWVIGGVVAVGVLSCTAPEVLEAQGSEAAVIAGIVRGSEGRALGHAEVRLLGLNRGTLADRNGVFEFREVPAGRHRVEAALVGYAPATAEVEVSGGGRAEVAIELRQTPLQVAGVQVTGTVAASDPAAVAQATTQMTGRALERELSATVAQTLARQPGIRNRYNGPAASLPIMRGLTGDRVLMLQDGLRSSDLAGSAADHTVTIDPLSAQRIEVVRGPATLLYGNNALGGVVNVISSDIPTNVPRGVEGAASLQGESAMPGAGGSVRLSAPLGERFGLSVRGGAKKAGDVRIGEDEILGSRLRNTDSRNYSTSVGVAFVGSEATLGGSVEAYGFEYGLPVPPGADPIRVEGSRYDGRMKGQVELSSSVLPSVRVDATVQEYEHDELDSSGAVQMTFGLSTQTANVVLRQGAFGPLGEGAWGVSGLFKQYENTGPGALTPAAESRGFGVFALQEVALGHRLAVQVGGRLDRYEIVSRSSAKFGPGVERAFRSFSGSAGVRVDLGGGISASGSVSRSFRAPTVEELFSGALHAGTGAVEYGTPTLRAETGVGAEVVLRASGPLLNGQLVLYRNRIGNFVHLVAQPDTIVDGRAISVYRYAQQDAVMRGVEAFIEVAARRDLAVGLAGDLLRARYVDGSHLSFMPSPRVGGFARWDNGTFSLGMDLYHELRQDDVGSAQEQPTPAHSSLRLDAGVRLVREDVVHSLTLRAENLGNEVHREATSRIKDFAPGPGRNIGIVYRVLF